MSETRPAAMWNLQGDASAPAFAPAVRECFGTDAPRAPNLTSAGAGWTLLWLGPRSWLAVASVAPPAFEAAREAIAAAGGALFDVSAARVGWMLTGPHAASVLAKFCPLDLHPGAFAVGTCAQSVLGHVNALLHRTAPDEFALYVSRSYARDVAHLLREAGAQYGCEFTA